MKATLLAALAVVSGAGLMTATTQQQSEAPTYPVLLAASGPDLPDPGPNPFAPTDPTPPTKPAGCACDPCSCNNCGCGDVVAVEPYCPPGAT